RDFQGCKTNPFGSGSATVIKVQTRMVHEDGESAANQHHHEKEVEEMAVPQPRRKAVRTSEVVGIDLRNCWDRRQSSYGDLDPCRGNNAGDSNCDACQNRRSYPNSKSPIFRIVNGPMCCVEWDHIVFYRDLRHKSPSSNPQTKIAPMSR